MSDPVFHLYFHWVWEALHWGSSLQLSWLHSKGRVAALSLELEIHQTRWVLRVCGLGTVIQILVCHWNMLKSHQRKWPKVRFNSCSPVIFDMHLAVKLPDQMVAANSLRFFSLWDQAKCHYGFTVQVRWETPHKGWHCFVNAWPPEFFNVCLKLWRRMSHIGSCSVHRYTDIL